ncbi:UNVERIFIED_CONTAM: hypothetical protein Sradi_3108800 [Sesamum radiatum]|uniref:Uncharacterized protein n=1 Tax=Sesamum radiatum TaxID=300843 RepID=A0AAW2RF80_SESRA
MADINGGEIHNKYCETVTTIIRRAMQVITLFSPPHVLCVLLLPLPLATLVLQIPFEPFLLVQEVMCYAKAKGSL